MRLVFLSIPPSFSAMVTRRYHLPLPCRQAPSDLLPPTPGCPLRQPLFPLRLRTGRHRLGRPCHAASAAPPPAAAAASAAS